MRTRTPHWKRALAVLPSLGLVLASVPAQVGKIKSKWVNLLMAVV